VTNQLLTVTFQKKKFIEAVKKARLSI